MEGLKAYLVQKNFDPNDPRSPIGQNVNIIHVSMLYWPVPTQPRVMRRREEAPSMGGDQPPPVRAAERPHGEEPRMNSGIRVSGI